MSKAASYALRLPVSVMREAKRIAAEEGISLNQFISSAVAEKLAALQTREIFVERARRADLAKFDEIMARIGNEPPRLGDELPE
ncbi:MAG: toxin-antitoxin system HicB family antitoxin [Geminicoccaceae bacterium]